MFPSSWKRFLLLVVHAKVITSWNELKACTKTTHYSTTHFCCSPWFKKKDFQWRNYLCLGSLHSKVISFTSWKKKVGFLCGLSKLFKVAGVPSFISLQTTVLQCAMGCTMPGLKWIVTYRHVLARATTLSSPSIYGVHERDNHSWCQPLPVCGPTTSIGLDGQKQRGAASPKIDALL